jgi:hypothetical protein
MQCLNAVRVKAGCQQRLVQKKPYGAAGVNIKTRNDGNCDTMAHNRVKLHQLAHGPEPQATVISKAGIL